MGVINIKSRQVFLTMLIALFISAVLIFGINFTVNQNAIIKQAQLRLQATSRSTEELIEEQIDNEKTKLILLAQKPIIIEHTDIPLTRATLKNALATNLRNGITNDFFIVPNSGDVFIEANEQNDTSAEGQSLRFREYFQWTKTAKKEDIYVSEPLISSAGPTKGEWIVVLATPLITDAGKYTGGLFMPILLEEFRKNYINSLNIGKDTTIYIIDDQGKAISTQYTPLLGVNVKTYALEKKWPQYETYLDTIQAMLKNNEGTGNYWFMGSNGKAIHWISGYTRMIFDGKWVVIAAAQPYDTVFSPINDFLANPINWIFFILSAGAIFIFIESLIVLSYKKDQQAPIRDNSH